MSAYSSNNQAYRKKTRFIWSVNIQTNAISILFCKEL